MQSASREMATPFFFLGRIVASIWADRLEDHTQWGQKSQGGGSGSSIVFIGLEKSGDAQKFDLPRKGEIWCFQKYEGATLVLDRAAVRILWRPATGGPAS